MLNNSLSKTLFLKRWFLSVLLIFMVGGIAMGPRDAKASIFTDIWKFLSGSGDASAKDTPSLTISMPLLGSSRQAPTPGGVGGPTEDNSPALPVTQDSALIAPRNPAGTLPSSGSDQISVYTVAEGDTPSSIADLFGISLNTLLWANNLKKSGSIKVGDTLVILPVSGVQYEIKKGDTIASIAKKFKPKNIGSDDFDSFVNDIISYNGLAINENLQEGDSIIIPDGEVGTVSTPTPAPVATAKGGKTVRSTSLPEYIGYYLRPLLGGRKTQGLHGYNGVDLANSCGTNLMAAADGIVIVSRLSGWNTGYGKYVVISHPNHTQTVYGHMQDVFVGVGQSVRQGQSIGLLGTTGNSTGCHVHFEIRGARNPF